jgi:hypothetical protein
VTTWCVRRVGKLVRELFWSACDWKVCAWKVLIGVVCDWFVVVCDWFVVAGPLVCGWWATDLWFLCDCLWLVSCWFVVMCNCVWLVSRRFVIVVRLCVVGVQLVCGCVRLCGWRAADLWFVCDCLWLVSRWFVVSVPLFVVGVRLFVVGEQLMCGYARLVVGEPLICG